MRSTVDRTSPRSVDVPRSSAAVKSRRESIHGPSAPTVDLLAKRTQDLELDEVLRTAGGALHRDQVVEAGHPDLDAEDLDGDRSADQLLEVKAGVRMGEEVEVSVPGGEREHVARSQGSTVDGSLDTFDETAPHRGHRNQGLAQPLEVVAIKREAHVDITGQRRRAVDLGRESTDEDEPNLVIKERLEDAVGPEEPGTRSFGEAAE